MMITKHLFIVNKNSISSIVIIPNLICLGLVKSGYSAVGAPGSEESGVVTLIRR